MKIKFFSGLLYLLMLAFQGLAQTSKRPNILWITIEDTSPQFIGAYGNKDAVTPNIDKLFAQGTTFTNAFSTGTVCSPSRTTIITGVRTYVAGTGAHRSSVLLPEAIQGFPYYMRQQGYYTSNNVKTDYNIAQQKNFVENAWNESSNGAGWSKRTVGQPFFSVFNFMESHQSMTMTLPYDKYREQILEALGDGQQIADTDFSVPPIYRDSPEMRKELARVYNALKLTDRRVGALIARLEKDKLRDSTIIFFFSDHGEGLPRGKTNGIGYGYRVPFAVWFPPMYQHLSPWGLGGGKSDELISFEDLAPTMIALAAGKKPTYLNGRTLIGAQRSKLVDHLTLSNDRSDNGGELSRTVTDGRFIYTRNFMPQRPELRYIRYMEIGRIKELMRQDLKQGKLSDFQKTLFQPRATEVLYDTQMDPWEMENLALDSKYRSKLNAFRSLMDKDLLLAKDVMFLPEFQAKSVSKQRTLYEFREDEKAYPFKQIYATAKLVGETGTRVGSRQLKMLRDTNAVVRYWAMMGLLAHGVNDLPELADALAVAIEDTYPPVCVLACISGLGYDEVSTVAQQKLIAYIQGNNIDLSLLAIDHLLYQKQTDVFIAPVQQLVKRKGIDYNLKSACEDFLAQHDVMTTP